jgi:hypothetical protein
VVILVTNATGMGRISSPLIRRPTTASPMTRKLACIADTNKALTRLSRCRMPTGTS